MRFWVGRGTPNPGRSMPGMRPTMSTPPATMAPVFPAETHPWASPDRTMCMATQRLAFLFFRMATAGVSSMAMTSSAGTM